VARVERIQFLQESITDYSKVILTFEDDRAKLLRSREVADEKEAARLVQKLAEVQRGLDLLEEALASIKAQLDEETSRPESDHER
jgi:hypothetical protein